MLCAEWVSHVNAAFLLGTESKISTVVGLVLLSGFPAMFLEALTFYVPLPHVTCPDGPHASHVSGV